MTSTIKSDITKMALKIKKGILLLLNDIPTLGAKPPTEPNRFSMFSQYKEISNVVMKLHGIVMEITNMRYLLCKLDH
jgi:hypothetical protein